ncbi:MAG: acetyl-CoA carboxylase biotin carboxyl carrier protein [Rhodospirillales bacterium]|jgi:acetyl-CoA carboxylase biotin carboxyl carrier protein|nr:acetyl-CoA carboxylase biotin carboxyl carrier protein [Rhodospirillales bacterium]
MPRDGNKPDIDATLVKKLARLLDQTGLTEIEYGQQDWHLRVSKNVAAPAMTSVSVAPPAAAAAPAAPEPAADADDISKHPGLVSSPMVGVGYTQSDPDTAPFVQIGGHVNEGDTILLIEAMKVFNPIKAPRSGKVTRIMLTNGAPVEFGEPLMIIE